MRVLVTGAHGFIGAQIVAALTTAGHDVVCGVRRPDPQGRFAHLKTVACDFTRDIRTEDWLPRLVNIDAVVNGAGILRETKAQTFATVHQAVPRALFDACVQARVKKVIQISALGAPEDTAFVRSKHEADAHLATLDIDWIILRPSVVYTPAGSYGGTSLLRAMAAFPGLLPVPGSGQQRLQPILGDDLAQAVVQLLEGDRGNRKILEAVGPESLTIEQYLSAWRRWLGFTEPRIVRVPLALIRPVVWLSEKFGRGPLGKTMFRMLERGNVGGPQAYDRFSGVVGFHPRALAEVLNRTPSHVQDRWHARLYFLRPALRVTLGLLWVASGLVGLWMPPATSTALLASAGVSSELIVPLVYGASSFDLVLGVALLARYRTVLTGALMIAMLVGYMLFLGLALPQVWLEPFGGLIKNVPLISAVLIMMVLEGER